MDTQTNDYEFENDNVNWMELEAIGIFRDDLEQNGQLERLLDGERTDALPLRLMLLGVDLEMDATLQLAVQADGTSVVEVRGIDIRKT